MKLKMSFIIAVMGVFLSACSTKEKVDVKIEKKNIVEEVVEKQIFEAKKQKSEREVTKNESSHSSESENSFRKKAEMKNDEKINREAEMKNDEKINREMEKSEIKEEVPPKIEQTQEEKKSFSEDRKEEAFSKKEEAKIIDEQVSKLSEQEEASVKEKNPDYNPTDESLNLQGNDNFVSQFGEDEFENMMREARSVKKKGGFDYDLTEMKGDLVYATVFLMMTDPDSFIGKKFKMRGQYYAAFYEPTKSYYHYCFISDAAGCCQQGIEFAVDSKFKYPDDFPEDGTDILVTGVFEKYTEDDKIFIRLKNAVMKIEG